MGKEHGKMSNILFALIVFLLRIIGLCPLMKSIMTLSTFCKLHLESHRKCGALGDVLTSLTTVDRHNPISWNSIITAQSQLGFPHMALQVYQQMLQEGILPSKVTFVCIVSVCTKMEALQDGKQCHCYTLQSTFASDIVVGTSLVNMYGKCGDLDAALLVFNQIRTHDVVAWNSIITTYAQNRKGKEALQLFARMQLEDSMPDCVTFVSVLDACANEIVAADGLLMHYIIILSRQDSSVSVSTALGHMYYKCGYVDDAWAVFSRMPERSVVSWNTMITICGQQSQGQNRKVTDILAQMLHEAVVPDKVTFINLFHSFTCLARGKQVHASLLASCLELDNVLFNALMTMYGKCGDPQKAEQVFDRISDRNLISWNAMMVVYNQCGFEAKTHLLFERMRQERMEPNKVTYISYLAACNSPKYLAEGKKMHAFIQGKFLVHSDISIGTALVNMYAKCGRLKNARNVFDEFLQRDVVLWSAVISAYAQKDESKEALMLVEQMQQEGALPDKVTYVSMLDACAAQAMVKEGMLVHGRVGHSFLDSDVIVGTALLHMYGKCGYVEKAREMFNEMPTRSLISWNAMLSIYSTQGHGKQALALFSEMKEKGVVPDKCTFVSVLASCSHCGLVREGRNQFHSMQAEYSISPVLDHYVCMIDLFGRTGHLEEAESLLHEMPVQPTVAPLMAFLGACRYQVDGKRGEQFATHAFELDTENPAPHVMLSNIYSAAGRVEDAKEVMIRLRT